MAALQPSTSNAGSTEPFDVVVVGAGLAGLTTASRLEKAGRTVLVLEARDRVGGRLLSTDDGVDYGGSWIWSGDSRVRALGAALGVGTVPQSLENASSRVIDGRERSLERMGDGLAPCGPGASRWVGGAAALPKSLEASLEKKPKLGCRVAAIVEEAPDRRRVHYYEHGADLPASVACRRVVVAVPPAVHARIRYEPPLPRERLERCRDVATWCGDWCKIVAAFAVPFWRDRGHSGVVDHRDEPHTVWWDGGAASLVGLAAGERTRAFAAMDDAALRKLVVTVLSPVFGDDVEAHLVRVTAKAWIADEATYGGGKLLCYGDPLLREPHGGVHFAGAETEPGNGHKEGAVRSAERVLRELGVAWS